MDELELERALFVSLDETLITTISGNKYPIHSKDWKFNLDIIKAIDYFYKKGYYIIIISNQVGIEKGFTIEKVFTDKMNHICKVIEKELDITIRNLIYSYCSKDNNYYTMPNPGQGYECAIDYELDLNKCIMIGNNEVDEEFAKNCNMKAYYSLEKVININWNTNA